MIDPRFGLAGKTALITGSTRGIGLATARMMAEAGARVVISSRKPEACEAVAAQFAAEGHEVLALPCHVGRSEDIHRLVDTVLERWGVLDIVVANAAINPVFAPLQEIEPATWQKVMDTNVTGTWLLAKRALPAIAERGSGAMIMVSSITSILGVPNSGPYAISKAAENHLARQLAVEWGPRNIRVNVVAPGTTKTDMIRNILANAPATEARLRSIPLCRMAEPEEVAAAIYFLATEAARHITGQVIVVDGGQSLGGDGWSKDA